VGYPVSAIVALAGSARPKQPEASSLAGMTAKLLAAQVVGPREDSYQDSERRLHNTRSQTSPAEAEALALAQKPPAGHLLPPTKLLPLAPPVASQHTLCIRLLTFAQASCWISTFWTPIFIRVVLCQFAGHFTQFVIRIRSSPVYAPSASTSFPRRCDSPRPRQQTFHELVHFHFRHLRCDRIARSRSNIESAVLPGS